MAILKLYNDDMVVELLNDEADTENPLDNWSFDGNCGMPTERTLFVYVDEGNHKFWRAISIRYNMANDTFYVNNIGHEDGFEIDLNDDSDIFKYVMVDTENIVDFQEMMRN